MTLFIFPHKKERDLVLQELKGAGSFSAEPVIFSEGVYAFSGQGKVAMALAVQSLCQRHPELQNVLCLGTAGALSPSLKAGDVILGELTVEHDFRVRAREISMPRFSASEKLLQQFPDTIQRGVIASGDEDVMGETPRTELHARTGALCVAWEGAGAARAAKHLSKNFLEIRAITDFAGSGAAVEFENNLRLAMSALGKLMKYYIAR